ncbi:tetratricopeptide repeat protein, partial [Kitasatospora sp. NPDC002227]|uniref:tetratricopeptide repeat protein n=1 Tax=Kitasatospora sp. NPDC002227 TaxID=3154773 RepID=UPI0033274C4F
EAAAHILAQCAGLPLAIRIAGARLAARPAWTLRSLADRLAGARRLDELAIEDAAVRATFRVSYDALCSSLTVDDRAAARAFRLLGLWGGADLSLEAAAALLDCSVDEADYALETLVDAHLLENPVMGRYRLHDLLRAYARECAEAETPAAERESAGQRLVSWYLYAVAAATDWFNRERTSLDYASVGAAPPAALPVLADRAAAIEWARQERSNFRVVTELAAAGPHPLAACMLGGELFHVFTQTAFWAELRACDTIGLEAARQLGDPVSLAKMLTGLSTADRVCGDLEGSLAKAREGLGFAEQGDNPHTHFTSMIHYASSLHCVERYEEAITAYERAFAERRGPVREGPLAAAMNNLGFAYHKLRRYQEAIERYRPALELSRASRTLYVEAAILDGIGQAHLGAGDAEEAVSWLRQAIALRVKLGDQGGTGSSLDHLGDAHRLAGRLDEARDSWTRAVTALEAVRHPGADAVRAKLA